jgi:hypothetical protein
MWMRRRQKMMKFEWSLWVQQKIARIMIGKWKKMT